MAATGTINIIAELLGLGKDLDFIDRFTLTETPTKSTKQYRIQATGGTAEVLDLGGVATIDLIIIKAVANDLLIDTSNVGGAGSFVEELNISQGEIAVFKPGGTVFIDNETGEEQCTYEYIVIGR